MSYLNYIVAAFGLVLLGLSVNYLLIKKQLKHAKRWARQMQEGM